MREETLKKIIEDQETEIDNLKKKIQELEGLLEDKKEDNTPDPEDKNMLNGDSVEIEKDSLTL